MITPDAISNVYVRIIVQVIVWMVLPSVIAFFLARKYRTLLREFESSQRERLLESSDALVVITAIGCMLGCLILGIANICIVRIVGIVQFTHDDLSNSASIWILLLVGEVSSIVLLCYQGWFYGTRIAWTAKTGPSRPMENYGTRSNANTSYDSIPIDAEIVEDPRPQNRSSPT